MIIDCKKLWEDALTEIELDVSPANFNTWFRGTFISRYESGTIFLGVPSTFVKDWLESKFHRYILKALRNIQADIRSLEYIVNRNEEKQRSRSETVSHEIITDQLGLNNLYVNRDSNLNPKYILDNFIVGPFNEVAHAAAQAVIKSPGTSYNPLFIYGGTGLGKTHLIQAIGNHLKKLNDNKKVFYTTSENFTIDYVNSVQENKPNIFKEKYRKYDLLIMDDVQFFSNKEKSQEELFHLFNHYYENNKQIVFSSDKSPKFIPNLEERLRSRFEGGMIVDISKPDYESRLAILHSKINQMEFAPEAEVVEFVASQVQDSIRELEGVLNTIICQTQAKRKPLSMNEIKALIKNSIKPQRSVSIKDVMRIVANFYNIEERFLFEKTRRQEVVKPRQIIMFLLREDFSTSYPYIGQKLGGRDHTTVIHACNKVKDDIKKDSLLSQEIDQIRTLLYAN